MKLNKQFVGRTVKVDRRRRQGLGRAPYLTPPKPLTRRQAVILALPLRLQSPHPPACGRFPCTTHHHSHSLSLSYCLPIYLFTYLPHPLIHHTLSFTPPCRPHPVDHTLPTTPLTQSLLTLSLFLVTPRFEPPTFGLPIGLLIWCPPIWATAAQIQMVGKFYILIMTITYAKYHFLFPVLIIM